MFFIIYERVLSQYLNGTMHLKPPRILVSKVTRYEGPCLEKCTPAQEHKETMKSDEIKVRRTASASGVIFISI